MSFICERGTLHLKLQIHMCLSSRCACFADQLSIQERSQGRLEPLEGKVAGMFVRLVELLLGSPPRLDCLKYVCDHLLLPDLNDVKLVRGSPVGPLEETIGIIEGEIAMAVFVYRYHVLNGEVWMQWQ